MKGLTAVVTGGTDGIGAATALELHRRGAEVLIVGRSQEKADAVIARAEASGVEHPLRAFVTDLSLIANVQDAARQVATVFPHLDLVLGAAGILLTRTEHTSEGIEKDFAVGYLSRFVLLETLHELGALNADTRVITIAASSPRVPSFAQLEFGDLAAVEARTGMTSHGQAQLANDLLTAQAARRYGVTAIGYGPGAVDTQIRREVPAFFRAVMKPLYARATQSPVEVGRQLADIFADPTLEPGGTYFFNKKGSFPAAEFVADEQRQRELLAASLALVDKAIRPSAEYRADDEREGL